MVPIWTSCLKTAEYDGIAIKSQIGGGVVKRATRRWMRLLFKRELLRIFGIRGRRFVRNFLFLLGARIACVGTAPGVSFDFSSDQAQKRDAHQCIASIHDISPLFF
jgi:hypothetical protein